MVRSMLSKKKIPKTFWPKAVNWAVYILNRSPALSVKHITPEETWSEVKPSVEHFLSVWLHLTCPCTRYQENQVGRYGFYLCIARGQCRV